MNLLPNAFHIFYIARETVLPAAVTCLCMSCDLLHVLDNLSSPGKLKPFPIISVVCFKIKPKDYFISKQEVNKYF